MFNISGFNWIQLLLLFTYHSQVASFLSPDDSSAEQKPNLQLEALRRPNADGTSDTISVGLKIHSLRDIAEQKVGAEFELRSFWVDPRLRNSVPRYTTFRVTSGGSGEDNSTSIWRPVLQISNTAEPVLTDDTGLISVSPDGRVDMVNKYWAKFNCDFATFRHPFGCHRCDFSITTSPLETTVDLTLLWTGVEDDSGGGSLPPVFSLEGYSLSHIEQSRTLEKTQRGEFSHLNVHLYISSSPWRALLLVYLPSLVIGCLCYISAHFSVGHGRLVCSLGVLAQSAILAFSSLPPFFHFTYLWLILLLIITLICFAQLSLLPISSEQSKPGRWNKYLKIGIPTTVTLFILVFIGLAIAPASH